MTMIRDMSEQERQSWMTLFADVCVFVFFWGKMVHGQTIANYGPAELLGVYIGIIVLSIIIHAIIASIFALRTPKGDTEKDERDIEIERRGARNAFWVVSILINIIIFMFLAENSFGEAYQGPFSQIMNSVTNNVTSTGNEGRISLLTPSHMFFALMGTAFVGDIVYRATMVWAYRG